MLYTFSVLSRHLRVKVGTRREIWSAGAKICESARIVFGGKQAQTWNETLRGTPPLPSVNKSTLPLPLLHSLYFVSPLPAVDAYSLRLYLLSIALLHPPLLLSFFQVKSPSSAPSLSLFLSLSSFRFLQRSFPSFPSWSFRLVLIIWSRPSSRRTNSFSIDAFPNI